LPAQEHPVTRRHDAPKNKQPKAPLYDTSVATPNHGERSRTLVSTVKTATLCTVARKPEGHPYGSFVTYATDGPTPVFLISHLAEHTRNLIGDERCSLLVAEPGEGNPLARGRVTLVGRCEQLTGTEAESARSAYLKAHPSAEFYIDFRDFSLWGLRVESARYIGGFGNMSWVDRDGWSDGEPDPLVSVRDRIVEHMNEDHQDAMDAMCRAFTKATDFSGVKMTAVDRYGFEMSVEMPDGSRPIRLAFDNAAVDATQARIELVTLTKRARAHLAAAD
jgi:putative heme iron utilization protein